jgi:hypothetical protein
LERWRVIAASTRRRAGTRSAGSSKVIHSGSRRWTSLRTETLATASADGTARLWDVKTQTPIGSPLRIARDTFVAAAFGPHGSDLFALSTRRRGIRFATDPDVWKRHACRFAGRAISEREWQDALPERGYRAVCADR